jgi:8-oxo-dGTP diphosphatase
MPDASHPAFAAIDWERWSPDVEATLLYVVRDGRLLLIHKKRGLGAGKLNGPGGKVDEGETPQEAAVREFEEELAARPVDPERVGEVAFDVLGGVSIRIHVFLALDLVGTPVETDEAIPVWVPLADPPYDRMWEDDRYWLPLLIEGRPFRARTLFDEDRLLGIEVLPDPPHPTP